MMPGTWACPISLIGLCLCLLVSSTEVCPPGCYCEKKNSDLVPSGVGLKINCHPFSSGALNFSLLPAETISLDMAKYGLNFLTKNAFASSPYLQKLDLQNNNISVIEDGAFENLENLEILDLSLNSLNSISRKTFAGLTRLEKLKLSDNRIQTIEAGSLENLTSLTKLDIADNSFVCNCSLSWFLEWLASHSNVLGNSAKTKCALPIHLADIPFKKLNTEDLICDSTKGSTNYDIGTFEVEPSEHQVVFEGDPLKLWCRVQVDAKQKNLQVVWMMKGRILEASDSENIIQNKNLLPGDIVEALVSIRHIKASYSGDWTCIVGTEDELSSKLSKVSSFLKKSVNILVMTSQTKLCPPRVTHTARGTFRWSVAVGGHTAQQSCTSARHKNRGFGFAYLNCRPNGEWASSVNASQCAYTSLTTETLHKFASLNMSDYETATLLQSARHFLNFTNDPKIFQDPLDVVYFAKAVENYIPHLKRNLDVGHYMMNMVANTLDIDSAVMERAQVRDHAAKHLLNIIENVTSIVPTFQHHGDELSVEGYPLKPMHFEGLACTWYSSMGALGDYQKERRVFHCAQGNKTLPSQGKKILANVILPQTLLKQIASQELQLALPSVGVFSMQLTFAAFSVSTLFPSLSTSADSTPVVGPIVGAFLPYGLDFNLTDPVQVAMSSHENLENLDATEVQPVWWNPSGNNGIGEWSSEYCKLVNVNANLVAFSCSRLGYYSFRISRDGFGSKHNSGSRFRLHHPVTYACAAVTISVMIITIMVYLTCYSSIRISRKLKHSLPNVWSAMTLLCFLYMAGIHQTQHKPICRAIGITIHYLTLSTNLWLVICTHIIYQKVTKQRRQTIRTNCGQDQPGMKLKRPITRFYLFGWGIGAIVVAITASINVDYYATNRHCFMKLSPFLGTVVVPSAVSLSVLLGFALSAYCVLSTAPSHVTEQIEVDVFRGGRRQLDGSFLSVSTLHRPDDERSSKSVLHSQAVILLLYSITWCMGALAVTSPSPVEQLFPLEDLFNIFFGLFSTALAVFIFVYFCVLRKDVRHCWRHPVCLASTHRGQYEEEEEHNGLLENSNLVNLYPNPTLMRHQEVDGTKYDPMNPYPTISDNLPPPFQFPIAQSQFCGEPSGVVSDMAQSRTTRGTKSRAKDATNSRKDSDELSSDHLSVNNLNHLRRGYVAPVNSGCASEADYMMLPSASLFGPNSKFNSDSMSKTNTKRLQPQTSSPAGSNVPQLFDLSPSFPGGETNHPPQFVIGSVINSKIDEVDSNLENGYGESSTIKVGQPDQMASLATADFPSHLLAPGQVGAGSHKSASMPRRQYYSRHRSKKDSNNSDQDEKYSVGSSTCYSNKSGHSRRRHKRPNRRRQRPKDEPVYKNVVNVGNRDDDTGDEEYLADDDQQVSNEGLFDTPIASEDDVRVSNPDSSQLIQDLSDLMKRETSV